MNKEKADNKNTANAEKRKRSSFIFRAHMRINSCFMWGYHHSERKNTKKKKYSFKIAGVYGYTAALCVFMPRSELNDIFDLGEDYYSGYFSDTELTDIKSQYIGSVVDLDALTKISRQLDVSMGSMMGMVNGFAIMIYMVLIYLLSKIIIEKKCPSLFQW